MAITAPDLVFVASERMIDNLSTTAGVGGGGNRGTLVVQDGVSNNVFPDVMPVDRITGKVRARLIYPSVFSADNDALSNAHVVELERPTDPLVEVCAIARGRAPTYASEPTAGALSTYDDAAGLALTASLLSDAESHKSRQAIANLQQYSHSVPSRTAS